MKIYHSIPEKKDLFSNTVATIGNFDGVHVGHQKILAALLKVSREINGDAVVVTFSSHPRKILNPELPIKILTSTEEKLNAIYNFGISNIILLNFTKKMAVMHAQDFYQDILINKLDIRHLIIGYDHAFGKDREGNYGFIRDLADSTGIGITRVEEEDLFDRPVSSSWIRNEIESGNISKANNLLGRSYTLSGTVIKGEGRGALLGFPTANIQPVNQDKIIPGDGVYAVTVVFEDGSRKKGMLNIGYNPTFSGSARSIEVNILDFEDNIYDTVITVLFHERIRNEIKFTSQKNLVTQMKQDRDTVIKLLSVSND